MASTAKFKPFGRLEQASSAAPWAMYSRKRFDLFYSDIAYGMAKALMAPESKRDFITKQLQKAWTGDDCFPTLSVRTSFDLLLRCLALPRGSEVVLSAVTIKDMVNIIEYHGLVPIAVDLQEEDLCMRMDILKKALSSSKAKVLLVAHVFGTRIELDEATKLAHDNGIIVIEDCAEAYVGPTYKGNDDVDVSVFSFGTIKTQTAFGGCMTRVKDDTLRERMTSEYSSYPIRSRAFFAKRLAKYTLVHSALSPAIYGLIVKAIAVSGGDFDQVITSAVRGFTGGEFFDLIRQRPSMPLLYLLERRLVQWDDEYLDMRIDRCRHAIELLDGAPGITIPGVKNKHHAFWLFPVMVAEPAKVCKALAADGFDVTTGATQLGPVSRYVKTRTPLFEELATPFAQRMMESIVYLPITPEMKIPDMKRMIAGVIKAAGSRSRL